MTQTQRATIALTDMAHGGEAIGRLDGQVVFVPRGIPGEEVVVELYQRRRRHARGRIVEVLSPSPQRVQPRCPYFGQCGGCQLQHVAYEAQLELKRRVVVSQLRRIGGFGDPLVPPVLPADDPWHYRNHARFSVGEGRLGFTRAETYDFLPVDYCYLMHPAINQVLGALQGRCPPAHQVSIRYGVHTADLAISPKLPEDLIPFPSGQLWLEEVMGGRRFRISGPSFFQVNTAQAEKMVGLVRSRLEGREIDLLVDAYCGVGTFALLLADRARRVVGIEEAASAVADARHNAAGLDGLTFLQGKTERLLPDLGERVDALILDPARVGCHPRVILALLKLQPPVVAYVSCDPATLARDLKLLCEGPYRLVDVQPVDMFPQTYHIECVATLVLR